MELIFIHGPAAVGKLTVARELSRQSGVAVFHNHLVVDALLAVFESAVNRLSGYVRGCGWMSLKKLLRLERH